MTAISAAGSIVSVPAIVPRLPQKVAVQPQVNPKAIELFSASILECLTPLQDVVQVYFEHAKKASFDRSLPPPKLELPFSPHPCAEERNLNSDLHGMIIYPDMEGWEETWDKRIIALCSAYQLAYHDAFKKVWAVYPGDVTPLVYLADQWENKSEADRLNVLKNAFDRIGLSLDVNAPKKLIFLWVHDLMKNLKMTSEEHTSFLVLAMDLRVQLKRQYELPVFHFNAIKA